MHFSKTTLVYALCIIPALSRNPEELGNFFEGDMILTDEQIQALYGKGRSVTIDQNKLWPNKTVLYRIDSSELFANAKFEIRKAMTGIESASCVKFVEVQQNPHAYVLITDSRNGCNSPVGYQGELQLLNLGKGCVEYSTIQHELLHALGFFHEQNSPIRDDYVTILWENILPNHTEFFRKYGFDEATDFDVGYDCNSIMHYEKFDFSINGKPTILPKVEGQVLGNRVGMSKKDIAQLRKLYRC